MLIAIGKEGSPEVARYRAASPEERKAIVLEIKMRRKHALNRHKDRHHLLFWKKRWTEGEAKVLREDDYLKVMIPMTIHQEIHEEMNFSIPCPESGECRRARAAIKAAEKAGRINCKNDPPLRRLEFLIHIWQDSCPDTVACLEQQCEIFSDFYRSIHV